MPALSPIDAAAASMPRNDPERRRALEQRLAVEEAYALGQFDGREYYRRLRNL